MGLIYYIIYKLYVGGIYFSYKKEAGKGLHHLVQMDIL